MKIKINLNKILNFFKPKDNTVECTCGKYDRCIRVVRIKRGGYFGNDSLYVKSSDHFRCGKIQKQITDIKKSMKKG